MTNDTQFDLSRLTPVDDPAAQQSILTAISALEIDALSEHAMAQELLDLSSNTRIEAIDASSDGLFWTEPGKTFEASGTVYVVLNYGGSRDSVSMSDSFPAYFTGHMDGGEAKIDTFQVDTESFYD